MVRALEASSAVLFHNCNSRLTENPRVVHDASNPAAPFQPVQMPAGVNVEACELLMNPVYRLKPKYMGDKPHVCESA